MPTVSGDTFDLPAACNCQAVDLDRGHRGLRVLRRHRPERIARRWLAAYFLSDARNWRSTFFQTISTVSRTLAGTSLWNEDAEIVRVRLEAGTPTRSPAGWCRSLRVRAACRREPQADGCRLARIIAACSTASWVVTSVSPETVAIHRRVAAVIADVLVGEAERAREGLDRGMARRIDAGGRDRNAVRLGLHRVDEVVCALVRRVRIDARAPTTLMTLRYRRQSENLVSSRPLTA